MPTSTAWRPSTGADSVPLPPLCHDPDGPEARAAWARYWKERADAEQRETADEAVARCRAEADFFTDGGQRFDHVLDVAVDTFDRHVVDLDRPEGLRYRGMGLDECGFYSGFEIDRMRRAWKSMADAFHDLDRDRYRKAAAEFAGSLADLAVGMGLVTASPNRAGGAA